MIVTIHHRTLYRFRKPVALLPHRMALCPRNQPDVTLLENTLDCIPAASIQWTQDVFGNLIATASFERSSEFLAITRGPYSKLRHMRMISRFHIIRTMH